MKMNEWIDIPVVKIAKRTVWRTGISFEQSWYWWSL